MKKELRFPTLYWDAVSLKLKDEMSSIAFRVQHALEDKVTLEYTVNQQITDNFQGVIVIFSTIIKDSLAPKEVTTLLDIFTGIESELQSHAKFAEEKANKLYAKYHSTKQ